MQLLSTTDPDEAWTDFYQSRTEALRSLPPALDLQAAISSTSLTSGTNPSGSAAIEGHLSSSSSSDSQLTSLVEKYGPIIIGLLAGNVVIGAILCVVGLAICMRSVVKGGARAGNVRSSYAPVQVKEEEARLAYTGESGSYED